MVFILNGNSIKSYNCNIIYSIMYSWMHNTMDYKEFSSWETILISLHNMRKLMYSNF